MSSELVKKNLGHLGFLASSCCVCFEIVTGQLLYLYEEVLLIDLEIQ